MICLKYHGDHVFFLVYGWISGNFLSDYTIQILNVRFSPFLMNIRLKGKVNTLLITMVNDGFRKCIT